jgi:hypothetical protein
MKRRRQEVRAMIPRTMTCGPLQGHGGLDQLAYRDDRAGTGARAREVLVQVRRWRAGQQHGHFINTRIGLVLALRQPLRRATPAAQAEPSD